MRGHTALAMQWSANAPTPATDELDDYSLALKPANSQTLTFSEEKFQEMTVPPPDDEPPPVEMTTITILWGVVCVLINVMFKTTFLATRLWKAS